MTTQNTLTRSGANSQTASGVTSSILPPPSDPNSPGYQEFLNRGGVSYITDAPLPNTAADNGILGASRLSLSSSPSSSPTRNSGARVLSGPAQPTGRTTTSTNTSQTTYSGEEPGAAPTFQAPEAWTPQQTAAEVQTQAALGLRENRQALREAIAGLGNDPASRLALRDALAQNGINVERTLLGAQTAATNKANADFTQRMAVAQAEYASAENAFNAEWQKYLSTGKNVSTATSTSQNLYGGSTGETGSGTTTASTGTSNSTGPAWNTSRGQTTSLFNNAW